MTRAVRRAVVERRAVVLMLPLDVQAATVELDRAGAVAGARAGAAGVGARRSPTRSARAERPAIIGGRGAVLSGAGPALRRLGELDRRGPGDLRGRQRAVRRRPVRGRHLGRVRLADGAAAARRGRRRSIAFGASLNVWTTRHGALVARRDA